MVTIPNHSQAQRIRRDVRRLAADLITHGDAWQGNSYALQVEIDPGSKALQYRHWSTIICEIEQAPGTTEKVRVTYFDARYHSSTTRGFQGRLLEAFKYGLIPADQLSRIVNELALPTGLRGVLAWEA